MGKDVTLKELERQAELENDPKKFKFVTLYKARLIVSKLGTMKEREIARKQLKIMRKKGLSAI